MVHLGIFTPPRIILGIQLVQQSIHGHAIAIGHRYMCTLKGNIRMYFFCGSLFLAHTRYLSTRYLCVFSYFALICFSNRPLCYVLGCAALCSCCSAFCTFCRVVTADGEISTLWHQRACFHGFNLCGKISAWGVGSENNDLSRMLVYKTITSS